MLLAPACTVGADPVVPQGSPRVAAPSPRVAPDLGTERSLPAPDAPIPERAAELSDRLAAEVRALDLAIDRWVEEADPSAWPPPPEVELRALFVQRAVRALARDGGLARRTLERLPRSVAREVRTDVEAGAALLSSVRPVESADVLRTRRPEAAGVLLEWFREAERRFGVDRELLAAIMLVETRFGRVVSRSWAGAQGPMQFIPSTWAAYGMGGDVRDPHDAILGAANYLRASGALRDERGALHAYNPLASYVRAVSSYARVMRRDPRAFFSYYNWQVFVVTVDGDVRATGPGR